MSLYRDTGYELDRNNTLSRSKREGGGAPSTAPSAADQSTLLPNARGGCHGRDA